MALNGVIDWSQRKGWQVLLGLFLIAVFLKLGLILIDSLGRGIQRAADDGKDDHQTAAEQRACSLFSCGLMVVFSVVRCTLDAPS